MDSIDETTGHPLRILYAEDNSVNQKLTSRILSKGGHFVEIARNGREALEKYRNFPETYDLILMDIQMPEMDGIEATKRIRESEKNFSVTDGRPEPHIPIVAVTAHATSEDCIAAGMDDYITKPHKKEVLLEIIEKLTIKTVL